jgi:3',5'-cyclic AMP phosphodiesterase CpdA
MQRIIILSLIFIINLSFGKIFLSENNLSWLHISDIHLDLKYSSGSANKCLIGTKLGTLCCRKLDIPLKTSKSCNKYGDLNNDIPPLLFDSILNWTKNNLEFDFIINTGDSGSHHDIDQVFSKDNMDSINYVSKSIDSYFENIPVYNVVGNHDAFPNVDQTFPGYKKFLKKTTIYWKKWVNDTNMEKYGYYSILLNNTNIRLVVFNSLYYDTNNFFEVNNSKRELEVTNNQFLWLENEFKKIRINEEFILFANHIPLYGSESNNFMNKYLAPLLEKYKDLIIANLYGHSHKSRYTLYKKDEGYTGFGLINPSIYTDNKYPQFRLYNYLNGTLNFKEYYCNITKIESENKFECEYLYNFNEEFSINNINLNNLINLYNNLKTNKSLLYKYIKHYSPPQYDLNYNYINEILNNY